MCSSRLYSMEYVVGMGTYNYVYYIYDKACCVLSKLILPMYVCYTLCPASTNRISIYTRGGQQERVNKPHGQI